MKTKKILVVGNGYVADNFIFSVKDKYNITVYARNKNMEYNNVNYIYNSIEHIDSVQNNFDYVYILFGHSRPNTNDKLNEVLYTNVYLVSKILDYAKKNMSKVFYPATSLVLSETTKKLNYYSYSHAIMIDIIKQSGLAYTICYLHNIFGSLTNYVKKNKMVIDYFLDSYYYKKNADLINGGMQKRIFTHIYDVVEYMLYNLNNNSNMEVNLVKNNKMYSVKEIADFLGIKTNIVRNNFYSLESACIIPIDNIDDWQETIDIKNWIINTIKI